MVQPETESRFINLKIRALDNQQSAAATAGKVFEKACEVFSAWESLHVCECTIDRSCRNCAPGADEWLCIEYPALARKCADALTALSTLEHKLGHTRGGVLRVGGLLRTWESPATDKSLALAVPCVAAGMMHEYKSRRILRIGRRWPMGYAQPLINAVLRLACHYGINLETALEQVERSNRDRGRRYVAD